MGLSWLQKQVLKTRWVSHHHLRLWHWPCLYLSAQSGRTRHRCYEIWYRKILLPHCGYQCGGSRCQAHPGMYEVADELRRTVIFSQCLLVQRMVVQTDQIEIENVQLPSTCKLVLSGFLHVFGCAWMEC